MGMNKNNALWRRKKGFGCNHEGLFFCFLMFPFVLSAQNTLTPQTDFILKSVRIVGMDVSEERLILEKMGFYKPTTKNREALEADLEHILDFLVDRGFLLARITVDEAFSDSSEANAWHLVFKVEKGPPVKFAGLTLPATTRMKPDYIRSILGLKPVQWMVRFDPETARNRLVEAGIFEEVNAVQVQIDHNLDAKVVVAAKDRPPGTFDLALGYLPKSATQRAGVVGNGTLLLRSLLGRGEEVQAQLSRMPGQSNQFETAVRWPYVMGLPVRFRGKWAGQQRDSTFNQNGFEVETGYVQANRLEIFTSVDFRALKPGVKGSREGLARAKTWFAGIGMGYEQTDSRLNPRKGLQVMSVLQQGKKTTQRPDGASESIIQQRLSALLRVFVPTLKRQVWVIGSDYRALISKVLDDADLFRFGGATSIRGYSEEQFKGFAGGRVFSEYRYQLDASSYAFLFGDLGLIQQPNTAQSASRLIRFGYGLGLQYNTPLGLMQVSYAANPEEGPTNGRLHIGLKMGL